MKIKTIIPLFFFLFLNIGLKAAQKSIFDQVKENLNPQEIIELQKGQIIKQEYPLEKSVLPEYVFISLTPLTALEAIAIFSAYEHQKNYIPNLLVSRPVKEKSPTDVLTYYKLKMPWPIKDSEYTHGAKISQSKDHSLTISWYMVESNVTKKVEGFAKFVPINDHSSLFIYHSSVWPSSMWAGMLKGTIKKDTFKSYQAILDEFVRIKNKSPQLLVAFKKRITNALQNKSAYKSIIKKTSEIK